jgi:trk system potassium uptake protein TrkA
VLQDLRESDVKQDVMLKMDSGAEAIEGVVHNNEFTEKLFGKSLDEIPLPEGASIGAVVRHGQLLMPKSDESLNINDHLIIFLQNKEVMPDVVKLFKSN